MRYCFSRLFCILALWLASVVPVRADLEAGKRAYEQAADYATALKELTPLAEQGNADAQVLLGLMYLRGLGVSKDPAVALKWYKAAADQGDAEGQSHLGSMYFMGLGVAKDTNEALKLWKLSADQGNGGAQVSLGLAYRNSLHVPRDLVQSYMWLHLAALGGDSLAVRQRDDVQKFMTTDQIAKARALAAAWKPTGAQKE